MTKPFITIRFSIEFCANSTDAADFIEVFTEWLDNTQTEDDWYLISCSIPNPTEDTKLTEYEIDILITEFFATHPNSAVSILDVNYYIELEYPDGTTEYV